MLGSEVVQKVGPIPSAILCYSRRVSNDQMAKPNGRTNWQNQMTEHTHSGTKWQNQKAESNLSGRNNAMKNMFFRFWFPISGSFGSAQDGHGWLPPSEFFVLAPVPPPVWFQHVVRSDH